MTILSHHHSDIKYSSTELVDWEVINISVDLYAKCMVRRQIIDRSRLSTSATSSDGAYFFKETFKITHHWSCDVPHATYPYEGIVFMGLTLNIAKVT